MKKNGEVVSYAVYTKCRRFVFDSGNPDDYYVIFYYTYPEHRGNGYSSVMMNTLFALLPSGRNFYECIAKTNQASISAASKIGFSFDGFVRKQGYLHTLVRTNGGETLLYRYHLK